VSIVVTIGYSFPARTLPARRNRRPELHANMPQTLPWIIALAAVALLASMTTILVLRARKRPEKLPPLPTEWSLSPRPVFSTDERRVYRLLREALPHHVVLAKLPLVRLCQPSDSADVHYWYELLGPIHVTFAVCSANGRVLAAIDLDNERATPRRTQQIKQSVLGACRVRYLRCPVDNPPSVAELQLLVPQSGLAARGPMQSTVQPLHPARTGAQGSTPMRRPKRTSLWQDSSQFQDSFFAPDNRTDSLGSAEFVALTQQQGNRSRQIDREDDLDTRRTGSTSDDGGVVVIEEAPDNAATGPRR
jgi:Protein of unknown function (DUF2726)